MKQMLTTLFDFSVSAEPTSERKNKSCNYREILLNSPKLSLRDGD